MLVWASMTYICILYIIIVLNALSHHNEKYKYFGNFILYRYVCEYSIRMHKYFYYLTFYSPKMYIFSLYILLDTVVHNLERFENGANRPLMTQVLWMSLEVINLFCSLLFQWYSAYSNINRIIVSFSYICKYQFEKQCSVINYNSNMFAEHDIF